MLRRRWTPCNCRNAFLHVVDSSSGWWRRGHQSEEAADSQHESESLRLQLDAFTDPCLAQRQSLICELLFPSTILAVKLNRKALVIVLENEIYVYDIRYVFTCSSAIVRWLRPIDSNMRLMHVVETVANPEGLMDCP